jgi:hypothetical protein
MTQNQVGSTERRLAQWVVSGFLATPIIAILSRDLGIGAALVPWLLYAAIATPIIVLLSHREIGVDPLVRWVLYAVIAAPMVDVLARETGFGWGLLIATLVTASVAIYFLPAFIAFRRKH